MAYQINAEACMACGSCADACPQGAIKPAGMVFTIEADECMDCGICADQCATAAIAAQP
ncbi:4Fe-4S binding protein [Actomonas aquatica]|uniref:4Fe-4S binding protein n=1 Tax=Actomonas aquatica TaxID=2866162 RepID=A0ABZ1CAK5_9BACT|nr:4Fe-4S binding protein [Opitutus sp. WL0086]WRQ87345.1 4Fe-4S binding protein [Opitutus sp. WL0086]